MIQVIINFNIIITVAFIQAPYRRTQHIHLGMYNYFSCFSGDGEVN